MSSTLRRFEVLLPLRFNDGSEIPEDWLGEAFNEIVDRFGAASFERKAVEGRWRSAGLLFQDELSRLVVDVPDTAKNRKWMKTFKQKWKERLQQLEIWMVSYRVELD
jgi:hypothetical protein